VKTSGYNKKNTCKIEYPNIPSAILSVPHSAEIRVPVFKEIPSFEIQEYECGEDQSNTNDKVYIIENNSIFKGFNHHELNDLARDLCLF